MSERVDRATPERVGIPRFIHESLYTLLVVAGLVSVPVLGSYGPLPTTALLDIWLVVTMITLIATGRTATTPLLLVLGAYFATRLIPAIATSSPLEDFAQAYRWVLYLAAFALCVGRVWGPLKPVARVTWALLLMALLKSTLTFATMGPGSRPGLLLENNFELALFAGLVAVVYRHLGRGQWWAVATLGLLTALSGSRSGAVAFGILAIYAISQTRRVNLFVRYLLFCSVPALGFAVVAIFEERAARSASGIDRLNFLDVFLNETREWTPLEWIFGTVPITPLSSGGCQRLAYYESLFASSGDGTCYSVILHAFNMRVVFDAGLLGLLLALGVTWYAMRRGGVHFGLAATLLMIAFSNGFSVSGLNNPYVALPILLAIVTARQVAPMQAVSDRTSAQPVDTAHTPPR
ncbi:hypothetical protein ACU6RU_15215 [Microbacterium sp. F1-18]